jgi:hypothetical protein
MQNECGFHLPSRFRESRLEFWRSHDLYRCAQIALEVAIVHADSYAHHFELSAVNLRDRGLYEPLQAPKRHVCIAGGARCLLIERGTHGYLPNWSFWGRVAYHTKQFTFYTPVAPILSPPQWVFRLLG